MSRTIRILFLAAEADPFIKVGGLADVASALPRALRSLPADLRNDITLDVRLALPHHAAIKASAWPVGRYSISRAGQEIEVQVSETALDEMPVYLIHGGPIASIGSVYSSNSAVDSEKYAFFSLAALELPRHLNWEVDIVHAHDWHTALALYALLLRRQSGHEKPIAGLLTLHNLPFMGGDLTSILPSYGLPLLETDLPEWARALPLPLGLFAADAIVVVSPTYARQILTPEFGCGLQDFLHRRRQRIYGILNGLDTASFDPATDPALPAPFTVETLAVRSQNKLALQQKLGLPIDPVTPLLAMIGRLDRQKGVDLALSVLRNLTDLPWQFVLLGTGDPNLEEAARALQNEFPGRVRAELRFDGQLARHIYAAADMFLMPSRYEPCGLAQMIAMRYGCVPIVHATGGLSDTVTEDRGFLFHSATPRALRAALLKAFALYPDRQRWRLLQEAGMRADFSWLRSARQYFELYQTLLQSLKSQVIRA